MKNLVLIVIFSLIVFNSCEDALIEKPEGLIASTNFYQTESDAIAAINAAYEPFSRNFSYYQFMFPVTVDVWSDIMNGRGSWTPLGNYELNSTNEGRIWGNWNIMYVSINNANTVLKKVPDIEMDESLKKRILGEAHFIRALDYYHLVRLFGGVPLKTEPSDNLENISSPRASVNEVYQQILSDLAIATDGRLPDSYPDDEAGRISHWAAKTLLADVNLTLENWSEAASLAKEVITSGKFTLETDLEKIYSPTIVRHSEEIFSIKFAQQDGLGSGLLAYLHVPESGYAVGGAYYVFLGEPKATSFFDNWDDADLRKSLNLYSGADTVHLNASRPILFRKYKDPNGDGGFGHGNDYPVFRLPDALLIFAEADAMAKGGPTAEAYEMINQVRRRAYGVDINTPDASVDLVTGMSAQEFREAVFQERGYEFCLEAKRWFDMKRMGKAKVQELIEQAGDTYSDKLLFWPIPRQEIENNEAITADDQNPGW